MVSTLQEAIIPREEPCSDHSAWMLFDYYGETKIFTRSIFKNFSFGSFAKNNYYFIIKHFKIINFSTLSIIYTIIKAYNQYIFNI